MTSRAPAPRAPEQQARERIDVLLGQAGWLVQDRKRINPGAGPGVAAREFPTDAGTGRRARLVSNHRGLKPAALALEQRVIEQVATVRWPWPGGSANCVAVSGGRNEDLKNAAGRHRLRVR